MDYKVIPNFLPPQIHNNLSYLFLESVEFPFYYMNGVATREDKSSFYFVNRIFQEGKVLDDMFWEVSLPILYHAKITTPLRVQVNCFIKQPENIKTSIHTDLTKPHRVFLYSINTNNGYTILDPKGEKIKIPSVANQALEFDGLIEHQAVTQTDENVRINININYLDR